MFLISQELLQCTMFITIMIIYMYWYVCSTGTTKLHKGVQSVRYAATGILYFIKNIIVFDLYKIHG